MTGEMTGPIVFALTVFLAVALSFVLYFLPAGVAGVRGAKHQVAILALNVLLGWTCLGWVFALVWALADEKGY